MKWGINLMLFGDRMTPAVLRKFPEIRSLGFDGVEVPVFEPAAVAAGRIRRAAEDAGLQVTVSAALPARGRERYLRELVRVGERLGARVICGPLYKPVGNFERLSRRQVVAMLRPVVAEAAERGITLAIEPLNRFETDFLNTAAQGLELCAALDSPAAGLLLDSFHMHIEEKDSAAAIRAARAAGKLSHFHASENDRGVAGSGQVRWDAIAGALAGYEGWVVLETFNQRNAAIRRAVSCWRPFYRSEREFMEEGLRFVKSRLGSAPAAG